MINLERRRTFNRLIQLQVWNWNLRRWADYETSDNMLSIRNPDRFIGPNNAVEIRLTFNATSNYLEISDVSVEQWGTF